ncbi:PHP domain-containing protein [Candidatus Poribacteria bacterium]|nr:PHP domain-containing protein [Candidatus Poribacteria bacterium]
MIKIDLHVHTSCSPDSLIKVDKLLETCDYKGLDCIAVTDHDEIDCAIRLHEQEPSRIIVGEEIHTSSGEIIGLFLKEKISPYQSPMDTIKAIKSQGGLVYLPHPFDRLRGSVMEEQAIEEIWQEIDIVEVFNSRNTFSWSNTRALKFAEERNLIKGVGSDAHSKYEVGKSFVVIEPFDSPQDFLEKLADGDIKKFKTPVAFNFITKIYKIFRGIG